MARTNPRIQAQKEILERLLAMKPSEEDFDQEDQRGWERLGMGPKFYLYNGIEAFAKVAQQLLWDLEEEENRWLKDKQPV